MKCPVCNTKELAGKQKFCSGACRVKSSRAKVIDVGQAIERKTKPKIEHVKFEMDAPKNGVNITLVDPPPYKLSKVDQIHEDKYPGYHIFDEVEQEKVCSCGQKFKTRLSLNRFCADCKFERV